jgi:hypothetical protein
MIYNEALIKKTKIERTRLKIQDWGIYTIVVAPQKNEDFILFLKSYTTNQNISPISYSSNAEFEIYGIKFETPSKVLYKKLS